MFKKCIVVTASIALLLSMSIALVSSVFASATKTSDKVYYSDLFYGYDTSYLSESILKLHAKQTYDILEAIYNDYADSDKFLWTTIKSSLAATSDIKKWVELVASVNGDTDYIYEKALDKANIRFANELMGRNISAEIFGSYADIVSDYKKLVDVFNKFEQNFDVYKMTEYEIYYEFFSVIKNEGIFSCVGTANITKIEEVVLTDLSGYTKMLSNTGNALNAAQVLSIGIMLENARLEIIDEVIASAPKDSAIYEGMLRLKSQLEGGFLTYFRSQYIEEGLLKEFAGDIVEKIIRASSDATFGWYEVVTAGIDLASMIVFDLVFDIPSIDDMTVQKVLATYSTDLYYLLKDQMSAFNAQFETSDISKFKSVFDSYIAATNAALKESKKLELPTNKDDLLVVTIVWQDFCYSQYIESVIKRIEDTPVAERKIKFFEEWIYNPEDTFKAASNIIDNDSIYLLNGVFNANVKIESYIVLSNPDIVDFINGGVEIYSTESSTGCKGYTGNIVIPEGITIIGERAFYLCDGFTGSLTIPDSVTTIGDYAFIGCSGLTGGLTIPDSVTTIGDYAFAGCSGLTGELAIPDSVTTIGASAFSGCSGFTGDLTIPNSVSVIGKYAFQNCNGFDGTLSISNRIETIEDHVFFGCSNLIGEIKIPEKVTTIGMHAFSSCYGFTGNVIIPNGVTTIRSGAFYDCPSLTQVTVCTKTADFGSVVFKYTDEHFTIYGYRGSTAEAYAEYYSIPFVALVCEHIWGNDDVCDNCGEANISTSFATIVLDVPFYSQGKYYYAGDCGISSIAMVEAYKKGYGSNDITVYNAVYNYNGSTFLESYSALGYSTIDKTLSAVYDQLQHDNPVIVYRTGNGRDHYSVVYGYNGSSTNLEAKGFLVWNTYYTDGTMVGPGTVGYSNLETWLSGSTWEHAMIRVGNAIPLADKTGTAMFNQVWADNITAANAQIYARIPYQWITDCGFYIGTSESNMTKYAEKDNLGNGVNIEYIYYSLSDYTSLAANTKYYYKIYFVSGGTTYQSKTYCFYTGVMPNEDEEQELITWSINEATHSVGETNAVIALTGVLQGRDNTSVTEVGCYLYDADENLLAQVRENASANMDGGTSVYIWYDINRELGYVLTPNTTYRYKCFAVIDGTTYYSPMQEFTTTGPSQTVIASGIFGTDGDTLTWKLTEDGTLTISGTGAMADWNYNTTPWFDYRSSIARVIIENGVTSIGKYAFFWCETLEHISIPASIISFNDLSLSGCRQLKSIDVNEANPYFCDVNGVLFSKDMTELVKYPVGKEEASYTIPSGVTSIGDRAFQSARLETITLPDSIVSIGASAFNDSHIASITIPKSVRCIGNHAFFSCNNLTSISVDSNNSDYSDVDGVLFNKDRSKLIAYPTVKADRSYDIPEGVVCFERSAFSFCKNLENVTIPAGVTSIAGFTFDHCWKLTSVIIPNGVVSVGDYAFQGCSNLTSLTIPKSVTSIEKGACDYCPKLTIYGYKNSTAETYAAENDIPFEALQDVAVSGQIKVEGNSATPTLVKLMQNGIVVAQTEITGDTYSFTDIVAGTYDLVIERANHLSYTITGIPVETTDVDLSSHLNSAISHAALPAGDINGDKCIDLQDLILLTSDETFGKPHADAAIKSADINGDRIFDLKDLIILTSAQNFGKSAPVVAFDELAG